MIQGVRRLGEVAPDFANPLAEGVEFVGDGLGAVAGLTEAILAVVGAGDGAIGELVAIGVIGLGEPIEGLQTVAGAANDAGLGAGATATDGLALGAVAGQIILVGVAVIS